ncbi:hypothetical protein LHJ74_09085 [Streptomyces sp. N2-109]|uniref:BACON domain-containing protein n=1 Tax=Streptomyces gossypii TaxID=2883101 RepID=A0ABT2JQ97_9ACTN|nr:hypothetical protein [Streptomyces gossypii]MCT2590063.1 hypothetical protein [Streptomyces gossypii]
MKSSRREHPTHTTGAHRAHPVRRSSHAQRSERYGPYLDGLFTYCLSVMCEHDAATAALGEALAVAERQLDRGRAPSAQARRRPWFYALTRWACLRRLAARSAADGGRTGTAAPQLSAAATHQRRRELAALAWPEAAGTAPDQREALELAVRHGLPVSEVAAVLSLSTEAAGELLTSAACEVERTRAALAVVESGGCQAVARLAGDDRLLLGTALRRELVRHVDDCAECRRVAERAMAGISWPGTAPGGAAPLAVLQAPRPAVHAAQRAAQRARCVHNPRFDRDGFPVELKDRAARRDRLRSRAVTTTVVATVVAAPVLALWAAYRGAPVTGEGHEASTISATDRDDDGLDGRPYENAGRADREQGNRYGPRTDGVSVAVENPDGSAGGDRSGSGRLDVRARHIGNGAVITLTATGRSAVRWSASTDAGWVSLSHTSGTLRPGASVSLTAFVDKAAEPSGAWAARLRIAPSGAVITLEGHGEAAPAPGDPPPPGSQAPAEPDPPPASDPDPDPGPGNPGGPEDPGPSAEPTPSPDPTPSPSEPPPSEPEDPEPPTGSEPTSSSA